MPSSRTPRPTHHAANSAVPFIADRSSLRDAQALLGAHGTGAGARAAALADGYRGRGNLSLFCHWRQVERIVRLLRGGRATETLH